MINSNTEPTRNPKIPF